VILLWREILKNAKLSGKAKGTSLDASKIKINIDKNDCKEELKRILSKALNMSLFIASPKSWNDQINFVRGDLIDSKMSEEMACEFVKTLKYKLPYGLPDHVAETIRTGVEDNRYRHESNEIKISNSNRKARGLEDRITVRLLAQKKGAPASAHIAMFVFISREEYANWVKSI